MLPHVTSAEGGKPCCQIPETHMYCSLGFHGLGSLKLVWGIRVKTGQPGPATSFSQGQRPWKGVSPAQCRETGQWDRL